jgi:transposase
MDNALFHRLARLQQICADAGVKRLYLPPYSPDLNPIKEFFAELKSFIKRNWKIYNENVEFGFESFLKWCVDIVGKKESSAQACIVFESINTIFYPVSNVQQVQVLHGIVQEP